MNQVGISTIWIYRNICHWFDPSIVHHLVETLIVVPANLETQVNSLYTTDMTISLIILGTILGFAGFGSGLSKFKKVPDVMTAMAHVGVKPNQIPLLATLEVAGAIGLIVGIWSTTLGTLSAACFVAYFGVASLIHLKLKDTFKDAGAAYVIFFVAIVVTYLQFQR